MNLATVVLAAGLGTRMKSALPKVLHEVNGKPMVQHVIDSLQQLRSKNNIVVIGKSGDEIRDALAGYPVTFATQKEPKGTGDALKAAAQQLKNFSGTLLIVSGDTPLISAATLKNLLSLHKRNREDISMISFIAGGPHSYGRIIREGEKVKAIVENKDADEAQKKINEVNSGIYAFESPILDLLKEIKVNKAKGEYYLTDIIDIAVRKGRSVGAHILGNETELTGINTREDLCRAAHYHREKIVSKWMENGVSFIDRSSVFIHPDAKIGSDTIIYPNVHIEGRTVIGKGCILYPNTRIVDSTIGDCAVIKDSTLIESSHVKQKAAVGPFAHIRPGSIIGVSSKIGNFVEVKKSTIGSGTKASHLSYLGDADIGENVNIGAGTITCNYDGKEKHRTLIEADVFIGSDTQIVAPVRIGKGAYVGAGSTITKDVPPFALALSRTGQRHIEKWATRKKGKNKK